MRCCSITFLFIASTAFSGEVLFDFENNFAFGKVITWDTKVSEARSASGAALRVASGHKEEWPGITLPAPGGRWNLAAYQAITAEIRNVGPNAVKVNLRVDNPGADGMKFCNYDSVTLQPGEQKSLRVEFKRDPPMPDGIKLFGMRGYPPVIKAESGTIDPAKINQLIFYLEKPKEDHAFEIDNVVATGSYTPLPLIFKSAAEFFPFIDSFGQYIHADWPGKVNSVADLKARAVQESAELQQKPGPEDWNAFGGWKNGPQLEATGFFRTAKHNDKWWLIDPEGRLFFSHGIDCVRADAATPIDERSAWFRDFPGSEPEMKAFRAPAWMVQHGYYKGRKPECFDFQRANLLRKYGADWESVFAARAHQRLRSWGMNTIGNWSEQKVYLLRKTPYVVSIHCWSRPLEGSEGYWGQFKDVFDPEFKANLQNYFAQFEKGKSAGDKWCIGYFIDNELAWGDDVSLALATLASPAHQPAKKVFVEDLKTRYAQIGTLNDAWGTRHASWDALLASRAAPDKQRARADLLAFYAKTAEQYFKTCREVVKEFAPSQLYLGCRFAWVNDVAAQAAGRHCDVVSYNLYRRGIEDFTSPAGDVPLIVGEFHFGALDRGLFSPGLISVKDQAERAALYKEYVQGALRHPQFVGTHWFEYYDQPTTGRSLDEENYQIGFIDCADTPYAETIEASRMIGQTMYSYRMNGK
ncbi:MAG TPA: beta-galactosidase [Planctomycetota bacterium]|nr:beta-galactosidase [Planctomycetota bacterium]